MSSGEAELTGIVKGATEAIGLRILAADLGWDGQLQINVDSSADMGICRRTGNGKVKHLATGQRWPQQCPRSKDFELHRVPGADNPADMLTKSLCPQQFEKLRGMLMERSKLNLNEDRE